jgi:serine/threonine protein kinase
MEGTPFGRYRLIELLGRGSMGEVWHAHDTAIDRMVALKMLLPHYAQNRTFTQRFRREARAAARLDDPHVVPIYDVGELDGRLYVTMRLINGSDLETLLDDGPLEPECAVGIIEQVAAALHAAHRVGLVHRDIKPSNILITDNDFTYLIDFGITSRRAPVACIALNHAASRRRRRQRGDRGGRGGDGPRRRRPRPLRSGAAPGRRACPSRGLGRLEVHDLAYAHTLMSLPIAALL